MRLAIVAMLVTTSLSGCFLGDVWSDLNRPDISVSRTDLRQTNAYGYVTSPVFSVSVADPGGAAVEITASSGGTVLTATGHATPDQRVEMEIPDGTWTVKYSVAGHHWETFKDVKIDATPPSLEGLDTFSQAEGGSYTIGSAYSAEPGLAIEVRDGQGALLATSLPARVDGIGDGLHFFVVLLRDAAGNQVSRTIQVASGDAKLLPQGEHTFGIVARYTNQARLWDMADMDAYASLPAAQEAVQGRWLGPGHAITPDDPEVQAIVDQVVAQEDTTMEVAWVLFQWLMDELEYTEDRLEKDDLLTPSQTFANGGGVCRDLAAAYVSLLRAAGVPARLVSGYLAGNVNGFHAWVEFYGGPSPHNDGHSPWIPVDVSPIDGPFDQDVAVQAFGIQLPSYLALRKVAPESEVEGWSTAISTKFSYPQGSEPSVEFVKQIEDVGVQEEGLLCFDPDTLERILAQRTSQCSGMYIIGRDPDNPQFANRSPFIVATQRVIDYGIVASSVAKGTTITVDLSYPFADHVQPDTVEYAPYSNPGDLRFRQEQPDAATGTITAVLER